MSDRTTRRVLLWSGWIGLILAFMPFSMSSRIPRPAAAPDQLPMIEIEGEDMSDVSRRTRFTLGLPFSPWYSYETTLVTEMISGPKPPANISITTADHPSNEVTFRNFSSTTRFHYSWKFNLVGWSAFLAIGSLVLLFLARRLVKSMTAASNTFAAIPAASPEP